MAKGGRHQGAFGTLDNGTARPVLSPSALVRSRNTEHHHGGAITVRSGRCVQAEVASARGSLYPAVVEEQIHDDSGALVEGETYYARFTYVTAAGETDDLWSSNPNTTGPDTVEWVVSAGMNAARIAVPCHIRNVPVSTVTTDGSGFLVLGLTTGPVPVFDPLVFQDWLLYSRSPRVQDETHLGTNPFAADPLYHRTVPLGNCTYFDEVSGLWTFDTRRTDLGLTGWLDRDRIDIMMPDRDGLHILGFNVYLSSDGVNFYFAATGVRGDESVTVLSVDDTATRAPSTRVDRSAPTVAAVDAKERIPGKPGLHVKDTGLPAGVYGIRTTWTTGDTDIMWAPGHEERCALLGMSPDRPPLRCEQETWPSRMAVVTIEEGQGIQVTPPHGPEINSGWNLYAFKIEPYATKTMEGVTHEFDGFLPIGSTPRAYLSSRAIAFGNTNWNAEDFGGEDFSNSPYDLTGPPVGLWLGGPYCEYLDTSNIIINNLDPFDPATRGYFPGYPDIVETLDGSGNPLFLYASSRDDIPNNRHDFWFVFDDSDAEDAFLQANATHAVFRQGLRIRPGKVAFPEFPGDTETFVAGDSNHVSNRFWDELAGVWDESLMDLGIADAPSFTTIETPFEFNASLLIEGDNGFASEPWHHLVCDTVAFECVGFDVNYVELDLYVVSEDSAPSEDEVLQRGGIQPIKDESYTLKNPLAYRTVLTDGSDPRVGEWESLRPNNTAQWPVVAFSLPIVGKKASSPETKTNFYGCADSCFRDKGDGTVERIYHQEGVYWSGTVRGDWRFENYLNRVFICNEGEPRWNYRFDGLATYPHGLPKPLTGITQDDLDGGFGTSQGETPEPILYGDNCQKPTLFAAVITSVNETDVPEGEELDGETVVGFDVEYYVVYKRYNPATGRSHVVRSEPAQLTKTRRVRGTDSFPPRLTIEGWLEPEPQVTHVEYYRNAFATTDYYLVSELVIGPNGIIPDYTRAGVAITDIESDPATARFRVQLTDQIEVTNADLTLPIDFETGRPKAAVMMRFNRGRLFYVQQEERSVLAWTNITSPSGDVNPEGWYVKHVMPVPVRESSSVTCLSIYNDNLLVSCNTGMVGVQGISDQENGPSSLSPSTLPTDGGWMGPDAYCDVDSLQWGMTRQGPAVMAGGELTYIGAPIEGTLLEMIMTTKALYDCRCVHYRTSGRSQVWFAYRSDASGCQSQALVFDEGVNDTGDREQFWKEWTEVPLHGLCAARDADGNEYPLMGGFLGRTYMHGLHATDAGLFIERDLATRPFEAPQPVSFQPTTACFYTSGEPDELMMLDLWIDFQETPLNRYPIPVRMGGDCGLTWAQAVGGSGDVWGGDTTQPWTSDRVPLGGVFEQIQYRLFLDWDTWPIGAPRAVSFESTGFNPFGNTLGPRDARANPAARRR